MGAVRDVAAGMGRLSLRPVKKTTQLDLIMDASNQRLPKKGRERDGSVEEGVVFGIDASRNRSGGARAHVIGILRESDPRAYGISQVHIWAFPELLAGIADRPWLVKHSPPALRGSLAAQLWWQACHLHRQASASGCQMIFTTDASTVSAFQPMIVMNQDLLSFEPGMLSQYGLTKARLRLHVLYYLQRWAMRRAAGVIFQTRYAEKMVKHATGPLQNVARIPFGVGPEFNAAIRSRALSLRHGAPIRCLYVSNAELYKNHPQVIEAITSLRAARFNLELVLVGGGEGEGLARRNAAIKAADPSGRFITAHSFVPHTTLPRFLSEADLFVFASTCESLSVTLIEAMAAGLPIACSDRGPMPEVLEDGGTYFDPDRPESIAAAVRAIIVDDDYRLKLAARAQELAKSYTWHRCGEQTWDFMVKTHRVLTNGLRSRPYQVCNRCIMDTSDSNLKFNADGRCEYCQNFDRVILPNWHTDERGERKLMVTAEKIRAEGKGKDFDCIIGVSGGLDSSYLTYIAKEKLGLRPLMFHVDAGWNTDHAVGNIEKLIDGLGLDLYTEVINWDEMRDLQTAFLRSQIAHQDIPQDTAFFATLYEFARQNNIKYILTGGNLSTECCREPEEWGAYPGIDRTLILDVHRRFGKVPLKSFPITDVFVYKLYYKYIRGMTVVKPLDLIPYIKKDAEVTLEKRFGWKKFQHKHHESRFTRFFEDYWLPKKFGFDRRRAHFSSLIMTGQMRREEALERIQKPELGVHFLEQEFEYVANKLEITVDELRGIFHGENRTCADYRNKMGLINFSGRVMSFLGVERRLYK